MNLIKLGAISAFSGIMAVLFGGFDSLMLTLIIFMGVDYCLGILTAFFSKSTKTEHGGVSSKAGFWGLCKKGIVLLLLLIAHRLDVTLDISFFRDSVAYGFIGIETISIIENAVVLGVPVPEGLKRAIEILKNKEKSGDGNN